MGVSGSGKTTIGRALAEELSFDFFDGDDYHPLENIKKMKAGNPLNDNDRHPWLTKLNALLMGHSDQGCILACSALKESYRQQLTKGIDEMVLLVYLKGAFTTIYDRMQSREAHFMPAALLQSQFAVLEEPKNALIIDVTLSLEEIIKKIKTAIRSKSFGTEKS